MGSIRLNDAEDQLDCYGFSELLNIYGSTSTKQTLITYFVYFSAAEKIK